LLGFLTFGNQSCENRRNFTASFDNNIFMRHIITVLLIASLCAFGMMAVAEKTGPTGSHEYGESMSRLIFQEQSVLSGLVIETDRGISLTTNRGTFLLKGGDPRTFVGKNVRVTGVIREKSIFAVKINI
jgi:hypothetical protein